MNAEVIPTEEKPCDDFLSREERFKMLMETGEFDFLKDIPSDTIWKFVFALGFIQNEDTCSDAIRRQAVLETLDDMDNVLDEDRTIENYKELLKECYEVLPPVNPQQKIGHWEYGYAFPDGNYCKCSECKEMIKCIYPMRYCPNCGNRMVESQERSGKE